MKNRTMRWVCISSGSASAILLLTAFLSSNEWFMLPGAVLVTTSIYGWKRSRAEARATALEKMLNPAFGHDPQDLLVLDQSTYGEDIVYLSVYRDERLYEYWSLDSPCTFSSTYEYRIEGKSILERLVEKWSDIACKETAEVKDNVVLEGAIREHLMPGQKLEKQLAFYRAEVEWHELQWPIVKYFILSRHPEALQGLEFRRFFRQELERMQAGMDGLAKKAVEIGAEVKENNGYCSIEFPDDIWEKSEISPLEAFFSVDSLRPFQISSAEFHEGQKVINFLQGLLGETSDTRTPLTVGSLA